MKPRNLHLKHFVQSISIWKSLVLRRSHVSVKQQAPVNQRCERCHVELCVQVQSLSYFFYIAFQIFSYATGLFFNLIGQIKKKNDFSYHCQNLGTFSSHNHLIRSSSLGIHHFIFVKRNLTKQDIFDLSMTSLLILIKSEASNFSRAALRSA